MVEQFLRLESCKEYVQTPIQTLDSIHVYQPHQFLLLAKEAKKLEGTGHLPMGSYTS